MFGPQCTSACSPQWPHLNGHHHIAARRKVEFEALLTYSLQVALVVRPTLHSALPSPLLAALQQLVVVSLVEEQRRPTLQRALVDLALQLLQIQHLLSVVVRAAVACSERPNLLLEALLQPIHSVVQLRHLLLEVQLPQHLDRLLPLL